MGQAKEPETKAWSRALWLGPYSLVTHPHRGPPLPPARLLTIPIDIDLGEHCIGELFCTHGGVAVGVNGSDGLEGEGGEVTRAILGSENLIAVVGVEALTAPLAPNNSGE